MHRTRRRRSYSRQFVNVELITTRDNLGISRACGSIFSLVRNACIFYTSRFYAQSRVHVAMITNDVLRQSLFYTVTCDFEWNGNRARTGDSSTRQCARNRYEKGSMTRPPAVAECGGALRGCSIYLVAERKRRRGGGCGCMSAMQLSTPHYAAGSLSVQITLSQGR